MEEYGRGLWKGFCAAGDVQRLHCDRAGGWQLEFILVGSLARTQLTLPNCTGTLQAGQTEDAEH